MGMTGEMTDCDGRYYIINRQREQTAPSRSVPSFLSFPSKCFVDSLTCLVDQQPSIASRPDGLIPRIGVFWNYSSPGLYLRKPSSGSNPEKGSYNLTV